MCSSNFTDTQCHCITFIHNIRPRSHFSLTSQDIDCQIAFAWQMSFQNLNLPQSRDHAPFERDGGKLMHTPNIYVYLIHEFAYWKMWIRLVYIFLLFRSSRFRLIFVFFSLFKSTAESTMCAFCIDRILCQGNFQLSILPRNTYANEDANASRSLNCSGL